MFSSPKRRRFQFRLRTLFAGVTGATVACAAVLGVATDTTAPKNDLPSDSSSEQQPAPLPQEIVDAWRKAGANVCWLSFDQYGIKPCHFPAVGQPGDLPAFSFHLNNWTPGVVGQLPSPPRAFGMSLLGAPITDAGLKELAGLTKLRALDLWGTNVTGTGLKELVGLSDLQTLNLWRTPLTDEGLAQIERLPSVTSLDLAGRLSNCFFRGSIIARGSPCIEAAGAQTGASAPRGPSMASE